MDIPFVDLHSQYLSIKGEIDAAIGAVIRDCAFIRGPYVSKFEESFRDFVGTTQCVSCANGTDAIEIALRGLGIGAGDEVIVPANTWISTAEAVTSIGARVVFVDSHPTLYTIDVDKIREKISDRTRAIIPVHLYGLPAEMDVIMAIAKEYNLVVIEDTAQGHGAQYRGVQVGNFGAAATYSFFPGKNLGAYGDAGGIVTNDSALALQMRMIADHGRTAKFDHALEGRNSRLDGLQAAILSAKLPYLNRWTEQRQRWAGLYSELLTGLPIQLPVTPSHSRHVFHLYVIQIDERDRVREFMESRGVQTGIHYPIALPLLAAYRHFEHTPEDFPVASRQMHRLLSLPIYPELTEEKIEYVVSTLREALQVTRCVE